VYSLVKINFEVIKIHGTTIKIIAMYFILLKCPTSKKSAGSVLEKEEVTVPCVLLCHHTTL